MAKTPIHIEINESDPKFELFLTELIEEFERIRKKIPNAEIADNPIKQERKIVLKPNTYHEFGQLNVLEYHPKLINLLKELLPYSDQQLAIYFYLDFAEYGVEIGDLYNKIFEILFPYYLYWNSAFPKKLLTLINEWQRSFHSKFMQIEILIPLKGFYIPINSVEKRYNIKFENNDDQAEVSLKSVPEYSVIKRMTFINDDTSFFMFVGRAAQLAKLCIHAKGHIPFDIDVKYTTKQEFSQSYLWNKIKQIAEVISLEGTILRFGTPFYIFPWWISNEVKNKFKFHYPDWMSEKYMNNSFEPGLIPDIDPDFSPPYPKRKEISKEYRNFLQNDFISTYGLPLDPEQEILDEFIQNRIKFSDPNKINSLYKELSDKQSSLNFLNHSFILDRLLRLGQRERIEDVILDASLILESIFLIEKSQELSYRLKLNISSLLTKNISNFEKEFDYFNNFYKLRSSIIHGSKDWKREKYKEFIKKCYPQYLEFFNPDDFWSDYIMDKIIQHEIFGKISHILLIVLKKGIKFPEEFKKIGFMKVFSKDTLE